MIVLAVLGIGGLAAGCDNDKPIIADAFIGTLIDASPDGATVRAVPCPAKPDATIKTQDGVFQFVPAAVTIGQNGVVKFITTSMHNVVPGNIDFPDGDPGLEVGISETKCLQFTQKGTFGFHCATDNFAGTVTVK